MTTGEETGPGGGGKSVSHLVLIITINGLGFSTSSVDQQDHLSLFGVFLQDSLDLRRQQCLNYIVTVSEIQTSSHIFVSQKKHTT